MQTAGSGLNLSNNIAPGKTVQSPNISRKIPSKLSSPQEITLSNELLKMAENAEVRLPLHRAGSIKDSRSRSQSPEKFSKSPQGSPKLAYTSPKSSRAMNTSKSISSPKLDTHFSATKHSSKFIASGGGLKSLSSSMNNLTNQQDLETEENSTSITTISKKVITKSNVGTGVSVFEYAKKMDQKFNSYGVARSNLPDANLAKSIQKSRSSSASFSPKTSPKLGSRAKSEIKSRITSPAKSLTKSSSSASVNKIGSNNSGEQNLEDANYHHETGNLDKYGSSSNLNRYRRCEMYHDFA